MGLFEVRCRAQHLNVKPQQVCYIFGGPGVPWGRSSFYMPLYHCDFLCVLACFRRWGTVFARSFFWSTPRRPDGVLPGATEVNLTTVARVVVTESRRTWLYLRGTNSVKTGAGVCFFVVSRGILYATVCCVLQTYEQLRCTFGPSHVFSNEKASKRAVSNVWCKGVACMMAEFFVGPQKV